MKYQPATTVLIGVILAGACLCAPAHAQAPGAAAPPQRPGDEFKGLNRLSVVVEGLGSQAASCGIKQGALEAAAEKSLADAGLEVLRNSDEDTYLYVNVNATKVGAVCVSRYDVILYTYATARMPYGATPALVQVSLLRDAGMTGGDPAANGEAVLRAVKAAADRFAGRIREANK